MKHNGKNIESLFFGSTLIQTIKKGSLTVWEYLKSCFSKGFWINTKEWNNTEGWKN